MRSSSGRGRTRRISPRQDLDCAPGLAQILVDSLLRVERLFGAGAPYMMWLHQRPTDGAAWAAAHLHLHLAPVLRKPGTIRHIAAAELGAGVLFDPVDPRDAAAQLRNASGGV